MTCQVALPPMSTSYDGKPMHLNAVASIQLSFSMNWHAYMCYPISVLPICKSFSSPDNVSEEGSGTTAVSWVLISRQNINLPSVCPGVLLSVVLPEEKARDVALNCSSLIFCKSTFKLCHVALGLSVCCRAVRN